MALAIVDEALQKDYASGVVGVRGAPDRALEADVQHRGQLVRIRPAESALAVREVLTEQPDGGWLVVVTDRDDNDLGAGILSHFVWQRLRSPDPWEAVRHRFSASGIDPALTQVRESRELAAGLLAAAPPSGWPAAPAGVLTRRHALAAVAAAHLDLERDGIDALSVLRWTMRPGSVAAVATLREVAGDRLCDETLVWLADQAGSASECVAALLRQGEIGEVVPMGIVSSLLVSPNLGSSDLDHQAQMAMVRLESRWGTARPSSRSIQALGAATTALLADLVHDRRWADSVDRVLGRADEIVVQIQAEALAGFSDLLPRGLRRRVHRVAEYLQRVPSADATSPVWAEVEEAWDRVQSHALSTSSARELAPFSAAVRLTRWLSTDTRTPADLVDAVRSHMADGAWVDAAVNDALAGADDEGMAAGLAAVAGAAQERRRVEERAFAQQLAAATHTLESVGRLSADDGSCGSVDHRESPARCRHAHGEEGPCAAARHGRDECRHGHRDRRRRHRPAWVVRSRPSRDGERRAGGRDRGSAHPHQREQGLPPGGATDDRGARRGAQGLRRTDPFGREDPCLVCSTRRTSTPAPPAGRSVTTSGAPSAIASCPW